MESSTGEKTHVLKIELYGQLKLTFDVTLEAGMELVPQALVCRRQEIDKILKDKRVVHAKVL